MPVDNNIAKERGFAEITADLLNFTGRHLFLTGKAGTGKTTFLHNYLKQTEKKAIVVAPTGVAAINAGGMTIHSLFQFPLGMFIPAMAGGFGQEHVFNRNNLAKSIFLSKAKLNLIRSLELLIIDEVSMLRADLLDAMDTMLRSVRRNYNEPMGGVQVLYIGDLWQLPPVVKDEEWATLGQYYESPFFFSSKVVEESVPLIVELDKIYRQSDEKFIDLLNNIRNNSLHKDDFYELNKLYQPQFESFDDDNIIILTSHNYKAQKINQYKLAQLDGEPYRFDANVTGDFPDNNLPTEQELVLKVGTQIMFLKNDVETPKRYFNGKLAKIASIRKNKEGEDEITVVFPDGNEMQLEKEIWNNIRFEYNTEQDSIDEKVLGSFSQYPVKPAWAITIHKSQGLTFDNLVIDAGQAFAPGQVYVALSRCTKLSGITLLSEITQDAVTTDARIQAFAKGKQQASVLETILASERKAYEIRLVLNQYSLNTLDNSIDGIRDIYEGKKPPASLKIEQFALDIINHKNELMKVAKNFAAQLRTLLEDNQDDSLLAERIEKASTYFTSSILDGILLPMLKMNETLKKTKRVKTIQGKLQPIENLVKQQVNKLQSLNYLGKNVYTNSSFNLYQWLDKVEADIKAASKEQAEKANKSTYDVTLEFIKAGKSIEEIASIRNLAASTLYGHAARLITAQSIALADVLNKEQIDELTKAVALFDELPTAGELRLKLNEKYGYGECACVLSSLVR